MEIKIGKRKIGDNHPVFIIAEMSGNHNKSFIRAKEIIYAAAEAGADAIKLQTYTPDTITIDCKNKWFKVHGKNKWSGRYLYDLYKEAQTPWDWQPKLKKYAQKLGLILFSTPFDATAVDFLENINVIAYKVASFEVVDIPLLEKIGKTKKPVIISRGMATEIELRQAVKTLKINGTKEIAILHCVSSYPAKAEDMNLSTIPELKKKFKTVSGLSDHSLGILASCTAVSLGANIIEKHITLSRKDGGPDSSFSLELNEFKELVSSIREVETSIGKPQNGPLKSESQGISARKSLFVVKDIKKGEKFTKENVHSIRPGYGLSPKFFKIIIQKSSRKNIKKGTPLSWGMTQ